MCTIKKKGNIFILTLTGNDEHRLNPTLLNSIKSVLRRVRQQATTSSALITTAHGKFFSNGYDIDWAQSNKDRILHIDDLLRSVVSDLISLPMPTIAAVTGHVSTAGYILALSHDYVLMRSDREFLYMNEEEEKVTATATEAVRSDHVIPAWFVAIVDAKVGDAAARRMIVMEAEKITVEEAVRLGIVDSAHDSVEETVKAAVELGGDLVKRGWDGHVYADDRKKLLGHVIGAFADTESERNICGPLTTMTWLLLMLQIAVSCFGG